MTLNINSTFGAQSTPADGDYPLGSSRDADIVGGVAVPNTGTPLVKVLVDDWLGSTQAILDAGGVTASGVGDVVGASDIVTAIQNMISAASAPPTTVCSLLDVDCTGIMDGDFLAWNASSSVFEAFTPPPVVVDFGFGCLSTFANQPGFLESGFESTSNAFFVLPDNTALFQIEPFSSASPLVVRYNMSTPGDLSTATLVPGGTLIPSATDLIGMDFSADGMVVRFLEDADTIRQFSLASPYDLSSLGSPVVFPLGFDSRNTKTSSDGNTLYVIEEFVGLREYNMPTANSVVGMTLSNTFTGFSFDSADDILVSTDGLSLYRLNAGQLHQYSLAVPFSLGAVADPGIVAFLPGPSGAELSVSADAGFENIYSFLGNGRVTRGSTTSVATCP